VNTPAPGNPSYRVVNMVREKISTPYVTASDTQVARALGVSRAAVSAYKAGRDVMSSSTLAAANQLLGLGRAELADLAMDLRIDTAINDCEREMWVRIKQLLVMAGRSSASILLVGLALLTVHRNAAASELDVVLGWDLSNTQSIHYAQLRTWARRRLRKLTRCLDLGLKSNCAAPLQRLCARIRWKPSAGSPPPSWRTSPAFT
jgi:transcriptional regulator with XRE-family HTH domain